MNAPPAVICLEFVKKNPRGALPFAEISIILPVCETQEKQTAAMQELRQWLTSESFWAQTDCPVREYAEQARLAALSGEELPSEDFQRCN